MFLYKKTTNMLPTGKQKLYSITPLEDCRFWSVAFTNFTWSLGWSIFQVFNFSWKLFTKNEAKNSKSFQRTKNRSYQNKSKSFTTSKDYLSPDVDFIDRESNITSSENQRNRMEQRVQLLSRLQMYSRRNSTYDSYKDKLIDLEENFMNANE